MPATTNTATKPARGAGRPVGSSKKASLARILPAARKLFAEFGYTKTTFKEVGKAVGVTHAALYAYYPSKAALYQATCDHTQGLLLSDYAAAIQGKLTLREQLREILLVGAAAHNKDPSITGLLGAIPLEIRRSCHVPASSRRRIQHKSSAPHRARTAARRSMQIPSRDNPLQTTITLRII